MCGFGSVARLTRSGLGGALGKAEAAFTENVPECGEPQLTLRNREPNGGADIGRTACFVRSGIRDACRGAESAGVAGASELFALLLMESERKRPPAGWGGRPLM